MESLALTLLSIILRLQCRCRTCGVPMRRVRARFNKQWPKGTGVSTSRAEEVERIVPPWRIWRIMEKLMFLALTKLETAPNSGSSPPSYCSSSAVPAQRCLGIQLHQIILSTAIITLPFFLIYKTFGSLLLTVKHSSLTEASHPYNMASPRMSAPGSPQPIRPPQFEYLNISQSNSEPQPPTSSKSTTLSCLPA